MSDEMIAIDKVVGVVSGCKPVEELTAHKSAVAVVDVGVVECNLGLRPKLRKSLIVAVGVVAAAVVVEWHKSRTLCVVVERVDK